MLLSEITVRESADDFDPTDTPKWYIVRKSDDAVSGGPYDSQKAALADRGRLKWYDASKYDIAEGVIDGDFEGGYDKFKDL
jgi:hypothetical protein